jgi:ribosomal protein L40E
MKKVKTWVCRKCGCRNGLCRETCWNCGSIRTRSKKQSGHAEQSEFDRAYNGDDRAEE